MHDSPAVSHHDPAPDDVATGAGLVARVVFGGGVWACSLQIGAAYPGAGGMAHAAVSRVKHPRSPVPDPTAGGPSFSRVPSLTLVVTRMHVIAERVSQIDLLPHNLPLLLSSTCCCNLPSYCTMSRRAEHVSSLQL